MDVKVVAIEREDRQQKSLYGSSGLMLNEKYVITTANILLPVFKEYFSEDCQSVTSGKFYTSTKTQSLKIIWKNDNNSGKYNVKDGRVLAFFVSEYLKSTMKEVLQGWAIDSLDNIKGLEEMLSLFIVIKIVSSGDINGFKDQLVQWWNLVRSENINQCDEIIVKSVPFGNRTFLNSYSKGIVSNIVGKESCLVISDCPCTPGSEGSPVFKLNDGSKRDIPFGMVISSSCWWRGEWTGLTLIINIRCLLKEYLPCSETLINISENHLIAQVERCFLHVYCGPNRGTAIIIDAKNGILVTNSHVVDQNFEVKFYWKEQSETATILYKVPDGEVYDLAILQCNPNFLKKNNLQSIKISHNSVHVGEEVFAVGFAIFSKNLNVNPSIARGHIIQYDQQSMIKTTCCINPGTSGGALLNQNGELVGIIVCNTKVEERVYSRFNMGIPFQPVGTIIAEFLNTKDLSVLTKLFTVDEKIRRQWKCLEAKL